MKSKLIAAVVAIGGFTALVQPASACPAGYEPVWIQGNMSLQDQDTKTAGEGEAGPRAQEGHGLHEVRLVQDQRLPSLAPAARLAGAGFT